MFQICLARKILQTLDERISTLRRSTLCCFYILILTVLSCYQVRQTADCQTNGRRDTNMEKQPQSKGYSLQLMSQRTGMACLLKWLWKSGTLDACQPVGILTSVREGHLWECYLQKMFEDTGAHLCNLVQFGDILWLKVEQQIVVFVPTFKSHAEFIFASSASYFYSSCATFLT